MENLATTWLLLGCISFFAFISGCQKMGSKDSSSNSADEGSRDHFVKILSKGRLSDSDGERRRQMTLAKLQNKVVDPEPILLFTQLARPVGYEQVALSLLIFNEDADVLGFVIDEEHYDANGIQIKRLKEEYPAFVDQHCSDLLRAESVPVQIRDKGQRKGKDRWNEYIVDKSLNDLTSRTWKETLPPVWISIPEPNNVEVSLYVYDRAGHKSEPVKVLNRL